MLTPGSKLQATLASATDSIRSAMEGSGRLGIATLVIAGVALLVALAALLALGKIRKAAAA